MSSRAGQILVKIGADVLEFQKSMATVEKRMGSFSKKLNRVGKNLSMKLTAPILALGAVSVKLADTQAKAEAKVEQAIKSTNSAANLSLKELKKYASELQEKTLFGDEDILNNATAQLLTFTNIAGENFKRVQTVAMDLSTVLDGDLKSASIQLGKALNDPVKNLSALSRAGIQFSKDQTAVIKSLAETNRLGEAQEVILAELERQYGGQAEAAANSGAGAVKSFANACSDLGEAIGFILMPMVVKLADYGKKLVKYLQELEPKTKETAVAIAGVVAVAGPLLIVLGKVIKVVTMLAPAFGALKLAVTSFNPAIAVAAGGLSVLAYGLYQAYDAYTKLQSLNSDTAIKWVAEGKYTVKDEDQVKGFISQYEDALQKNEDKHADLGIWKSMNSDYRDTKAGLEPMLDLYKNVLVQIQKKKKAEKEAADASKKIQAEAEKARLKAEKEAEELAKKMNSILNPQVDTPTVTNKLKKPEKLESLDFAPIAPEIKIDIPEFAPSVISELDAQFIRIQEASVQLNEKIAQLISSSLTNLTVAFGEGLGQALVGDLGFDGMLNIIQSQIANFLKSLGALLISYATMMESFQKALDSIFLTPWAALGVGIAMVAVGTAMKSAVNKKKKDAPHLANGGLAYGETYAMVGDNPNARVDPEVIAPLSKLKEMLPQGTASNIALKLSGEFRAKGRDLVACIGIENNKINLMGSK